MTIYKGRTSTGASTSQTTDASTTTVAVNVLIAHPRIDYRAFGAFKFIDDDDEISMRININDMLKIPTDKLINGTKI